MFKKGDVVVFTTRGDELVKEDERFVVHVLEDQEEQSHFVGQVVDRGYRATHRIGVTSHYWSAKQFKLKQQDGISNNAFPVLKDGMVVKTKEPCLYLVVRDKVITEGGYNDLVQYHHDGSFIGDSDFDIVKVWNGNYLYTTDIEEYVDMHSGDVIWEENKNAKAVAEIEDQMLDLQEQLSVLQEKLTALREEK